MIPPADLRLAMWLADLLEEVEELFIEYVGDSTSVAYQPLGKLQTFREHLQAFRAALLLGERLGPDERDQERKRREELYYIERWTQIRIAADILERNGLLDSAAAVRTLLK